MLQMVFGFIMGLMAAVWIIGLALIIKDNDRKFHKKGR